MNNNFDDIPPTNNTHNQKRLEALNDALNSPELISDEELDFEKDAAEGLRQLSQTNVANLVTQLNAGLQIQLKTKKKIRRKIPDQTMLYVTIVALLFIIIVSYFLIKKMIQ